MNAGGRLSIVHTSVTVRLQIALEVIQQQLGDLAAAAGPEVARQIHAYVARERLGYYPALEFFQQSSAIESGLVAAVEQVGLFVCDHAGTTARSRLWPIFSQVRVMNLQLLAATLPSVRPHQADALAALTQHYTPNAVKVNLNLSSIEKRAPSEDAAKIASNKVIQWLRDAFESVTITDARVL